MDEKKYEANNKHKKNGVAILIADKLIFKIKINIKDK